MGAIAGDVEAVSPALVLTLDLPVSPTSLQCVGTLDSRTRHHLMAVVEWMLRPAPASVTINVEKLRLADAAAADALTEVQRMVREAGTVLRWHGVRADHLRSVPTLGYRPGAGRASRENPVPLAEWLPAPAFPWWSPDDPKAA